ncbi:MAG: hypothetical protein ACKN92_05335 [Candidatus Nanopelagicaceae bacterium]
MKKLLVLLALLLTVIPNASAAVAPKQMVQLAQVDATATNVIASANQVAVIGNREKNGFIQFLNGPTVELTSGLESFVSAATTDIAGNFYVVGASSNPIVGTLPPISGVLNPDNVIPDPVSSNKSDAVNLIYWKLDSAGSLIETQSMAMPSAVIPNAINVDANLITVAGTAYANPGNNGFIVSWNGKPTFLGKSATQIHAISKLSDGSFIAVGQSADKLLNTTLKGKVDGFLAKYLNGKFISVQRSSEAKANRAWKSATPNLLLGGNVNSIAAITKFGTNFQPTWTDRYPSTGSALTAVFGKLNYGAFVSMGAIKALPAWKKKNAILVLSFDSKGLITAANYVNATQLNGFTANSTYGPIVLAAGFLYRT